MLIERDRKRPMRLIVTTVIFLVVAAMIYKNSMLITTVDTSLPLARRPVLSTP